MEIFTLLFPLTTFSSLTCQKKKKKKEEGRREVGGKEHSES